MKKGLKKFFLIGMAVGAVGFATSHVLSLKKSISDMVKRKKLSKKEGDSLTVELMAEMERNKTLGKTSRKVSKKPAKKPKKNIKTKTKSGKKPAKKSS